MGTSITNQYQSSGIIFGGDSPFITTDGSNPTSPVLSGSPLFEGSISGTFVTPSGAPRTVDDFSLDVGYIDDPGSTEVVVYDASGNVLETYSIEDLGIVDVEITEPGAASFTVESAGQLDAAGFAIDNVTFPGYTFLAGPPSMAEQGGASNPSENPTTCSDGDPVNCATGTFWRTFTDFSVPGRGVPLDLSRTYSSSQAAVDGPFGYGWTDSYDMSLAVDPDTGIVTVTQEDGSSVTFAPDGSGGFTTSDRVLATLKQNSDGSYTFTRNKGGTEYNFSTSGQLTSEVDKNGYATTLSYSGGLLAAVADPAGRALTFTYTGTHVTKVTDPMGRTYAYAYDANGNLTSTTDPLSRVWSFSYDSSHLLLSMTDPRGAVTTNTYDANARVVAQTDGLGGKTTWSYTGDPTSAAGGSTTITDPVGDVTVDQYVSMELTSVTKGAGTDDAATTSYTYDPVSLGIATVTNPLDVVTQTNTYDASGNETATTNAWGYTTSYSYNSFGEVTSKDTPVGEETTYSYDNGNLTSVTDPTGSTTTYAYGDATHPGDVTSVTDALGNATTYTYDKYGNLASSSRQPSAGVTDTTKYTYDNDGERTCEASPNAVAAAIACPAAGTTVTKYDADGEVTSVTDPLGHVTTTSYDADGNKHKATDPDGNVTGYAYDLDGKLTGTTRPDGTTELTRYDADGRVTKQIDAAGRTTGYSYDALGDEISVTDPLGHVTAYGYDLAGERTSLTDPEGQVTTYNYNTLGQLDATVYSDGTTPDVYYYYDGDGRRVEMQDGTGSSYYYYDADGRLTSAQNGAGKTVGYSYNPVGEQTGLTYPNGDKVTKAYDAAGDLTSVTDWLGHSTTFSYDHEGNVTAQAYPNGVSAASGYDADDQLTSTTDSSASATLAKFVYAKNGNEQDTSETATGSLTDTESYSYNQLSQLASDNGSNYGYDASGDLTAQPASITQTFNGDGQLTNAASSTVKAPTLDASTSGSETTSATSVAATSFSAKAGDLLVAFVSANGPATGGQKVTAVSGGGLTWSPVTRSTGVQGTSEIWQAHTTSALSAVTVTATLADGADAAITVAGFSGAQSTVGAHSTGHGTTGSAAISLTTTAAQSLVWAVGEAPADATARTPASGQAIVSQLADSTGNDTFWTQRVSASVATPGAVKVSDTAPTGKSFNMAAVEILAVPNSTAYAYNKDGDLTGITPASGAATTLAYDQASDLTSYGTSDTYAYDGDGLRMSKKVGTVSTAFAWDETQTVPLLLMGGSTYYVYGPGGVPIEQVVLSTNTPTYLLTDGQGSVRLLTDATGAVTGTYNYGPYGASGTHTGSASSSLRYDGQWVDSETGLIYLQARYYNPATGTFLTVDPDLSLTLTPYTYADDDPINQADPSGQCPWCVGALIGGIAGGLTGAIGCYTGNLSAAGCAGSIVGGIVGGAVSGACTVATGAAGAGACGALGGEIAAATGDGLAYVLGDDDVNEEKVGTDLITGGVFGFLGGEVGGDLFPTQGRLPSNLSNVLDPGINAQREYLSGFVGGAVGLIPGLAGNAGPDCN